MIPLHNKFNLHTITNNSLYLHSAISQIPLSHLSKTQQSLPIKSTHHSPISIKIITQNTYLEVHNLTSSENTVLNCAKLSHNFNHKNSLKNTSRIILKCQIDTSRYNHLNFILISYHLQQKSQAEFQTENIR